MDNQMNYNNSNNNGVAPLVLGIISCIFIFSGPLIFIGAILGVIGLVLGINANKIQKSGMATAGIVLSLIGLIICLISFFACVACVALL
ncbi:hypothetical protein SDC9_166594 [bioreactor metagenome]|uniref:DUF4190 domain-containing protein n=1 Tax=bioreactor metagenome TaxID=1076179 RepID=A0A645FXG7_9ZZZZ